ncbi:MAG: twin-arginine translocase TatA/TatE family subunit [Fimbriimonadales bacterium]|nr:twin-arginine translocase TatA/TatE family subunit [Fimbriimonadales bacterium]
MFSQIYNSTLAIFGLSGNELLIIGLIILVLFGGAKIPSLMRSLGRGMGEFQRGAEEGKRIFEAEKAKTLTSASASEGESEKE